MTMIMMWYQQLRDVNVTIVHIVNVRKNLLLRSVTNLHTEYISA